MKEKLNIYVERVRDGNSETLEETLQPAFMEVQEKDVVFDDPVHVSGEAYVTDDYLIIRMNLTTQAKLVCCVCNNSFSYDINLKDLLHEEALENIRDATFDLLPLIRENVLLALPMYPQCGATGCSHREEIEPYLKKQGSANNPFKDLM